MLVAPSLLFLNPSTITYTGAQLYGDQYEYDNHAKKSSDFNVQKIKCANSNINVNGIDVTQIPQDDTTTWEATNQEIDGANTQNGNGFGDRINFEKNLVNICAKVNSNDQTKVEPPEPGTLTVNKQVFGCNNLTDSAIMDCQQFQDGSLSWLPCIGSSISNTAFCRSLPARIFDIEVLDDQNIQIQQFVGSAQGTTIPNLQPGTYTVNEIKDPNSGMNHLKVYATAETASNSVSFPDGGILTNTTAVEPITYQICIEYEDKQNNDCSTITSRPREDKTCTVKNYIRLASVPT